MRLLAAAAALLACLVLSIADLAFAANEQRGQRVTIHQAGSWSTAALTSRAPLHVSLRIQRPEEDQEEGEDEPDRRENPDAPSKTDGLSRKIAAPTAKLAFPGTPSAFDGPGYMDTFQQPPDTQGDIGPSQFIAFINGRLRSYDKTTGLADNVLNLNPDSFWSSILTPGAGNYSCDPRIRYDRLSDRWYALMIDVPGGAGTSANRILLAVSNSGTITPSTTWTFFYITSSAGEFTDYATLGIDANALYIGTNQFSASASPSYLGTDGYVVQKNSMINGGPLVATKFNFVTSSFGNGPFTPQGVDNADPTATTGYFIGVSNNYYSRLVLRRVSNPGSLTPTISSDIDLTVPTTAYPPIDGVPNSGGPTLDTVGDRLFAAQMRNDRIWTAHNIGTNASGVATDTSPRTSSRWYEIRANSPSGVPSLVQSGTVVDSAASNPRAYWIPSVAVNGQGTMLIAGSTAAPNSYVDAWYAGRRSSDPAGTVDTPTRYTNSTTSYNSLFSHRWGDYSLTRVDPNDDMTIWTIQEYVTDSGLYGTKIAKFMAPPPATPESISVSAVPTGETSTNVTLTGSSSDNAAFFEPGNGFSNHISATTDCGVVVSSATVNSDTSLDLDLDTTGASKALCQVSVTNPDGQTASSATGILQADGRPMAEDDSVIGNKNEEISGPNVLDNDSDPDSDPLTATLIADPSHGSVSLDSDGSYTYTPETNFYGDDSFTYRASDGLLQSATKTVTITVSNSYVTHPNPPTTVTAVAGNGDALISWNAPAIDGGTPITNYTVTSSPGNKQCQWTSGPLQCLITGLDNGTSYTFTVVANNGVGDSSPSSSSSSVTPQSVPSKPLAVAASAGNGQVTVSWSPPSSNGGGVISKYVVTSSPGNKQCQWSSGPLQCLITGLDNGTSYTFTVIASNEAGDSLASDPSAAVTPKTIPGPPTNVLTSAADAQVTITWDAPSSNGGAAISLYRVIASPGGASCTTAGLACTITGLNNGTSYTFTVIASNSEGEGPSSLPSAPATPAAGRNSAQFGSLPNGLLSPKGVLMVRLRCPQGPVGCQGKLRLDYSPKRPQPLAQTGYALSQDRVQMIKMTVSKAGQKLLAKKKKLKVKLTLSDAKGAVLGRQTFFIKKKKKKALRQQLAPTSWLGNPTFLDAIFW